MILNFIKKNLFFISFFLIKLLSGMTYAVIYSSLTLYITSELKKSLGFATGITSIFIALTFILLIYGGFLGGRYFSHRSLFAIGNILESVGLFLLSIPTINSLFTGLSIFLVGRGLGSVSLNCIINYQYKSKIQQLNKNFTFFYLGTNIGFLAGLTLAGTFHLHINNKYQTLFMLSGVINCVSFFLFSILWPKIKTEPVSHYDKSTLSAPLRLLPFLFTLLIIPFLYYVFHHSLVANHLVFIVGICLLISIIIYALNQKNREDKTRALLFLTLLVVAIIFWSLFYISPTTLLIFIKYYVSTDLIGAQIPPQWYININPAIIIFLSPIIIFLSNRIPREKNLTFVPIQLFFALMLTSLAYLTLYFSTWAGQGNINGYWIIVYFIFLSSGELFITPIGYSLVGQLYTGKNHGIMMATWLVAPGLASSITHVLSSLILRSKPDIIPSYQFFSFYFQLVCIASMTVSVLLLFFVPKLMVLMTNNRNKSFTR